MSDLTLPEQLALAQLLLPDDKFRIDCDVIVGICAETGQPYEFFHDDHEAVGRMVGFIIDRYRALPKNDSRKLLWCVKLGEILRFHGPKTMLARLALEVIGDE